MNWGPGRYTLKYDSGQVQELVSLRNQFRDLMEEMVGKNFPVGTKFRALYYHRKRIDDPTLKEPTFVVTGVCLLGYDHIHYLAEAEQVMCLSFKELDTLGRPNGNMKFASPDSFGEVYEIIED